MSYLARLKREISQNAGGGELTELTKGASVGFVSTGRGASGDILQNTRDQWRVFESLLAAVAAAYHAPAHEYPEMRQAAASDLASAIETYRSMAKQIKGQ